MKPEPKFNIGDKVVHRPDLYGETQSEVIDITRSFWDGEDGLNQIEAHLSSMTASIKWSIQEIEGVDTLVIEPNSEINHLRNGQKTPFYGFIYTVKNNKVNTLIGEKHLRHK